MALEERRATPQSSSFSFFSPLAGVGHANLPVSASIPAVVQPAPVVPLHPTAVVMSALQQQSWPGQQQPSVPFSLDAAQPAPPQPVIPVPSADVALIPFPPAVPAVNVEVDMTEAPIWDGDWPMSGM
ncbi:hypothetical protein DRE_01012 [Drechslerella stenobrocha 248]|uniref:Uncharacterized protein n=1 Tax=Drechslerella stenobrocha 248 TaxID=1043628 RepID=W7HYE7_9PEZI|nr:hypothetical protein DRE_01012 [Drechslerella stenobrocha 248]